MIWRHGDVLIAAIDQLPQDLVLENGATLARGEATGHSHHFADPSVIELFRGLDGLLYLKVVADEAQLVHEEHQALSIPRGVYRVWQQREYSPQAIRRMID
jgi:hypothetical protein